jgi:hydroxyacylglutathione hydrolase
MSAAEPPLKATIIPVTPLQQNCTLLWCTATMRAAFVDPGGDLPKLKAAAEQAGVSIEKILLTHGHIDHCGQAGIFAEELGVPIEGPHPDDIFWIEKLGTEGPKYGIDGRPFEPSRWLADGDQASVGNLTFDVRHCPGHTPGHVVFHHPPSKLAIVGDVLFQGSIGRTDLPGGDTQTLMNTLADLVERLPDETVVYPGHMGVTTIGQERASNPFLRELASRTP